MPENVIKGMRHAVSCPFVLDRARACDCHPLDESKAMRSDDVLRIFSPVPEEEAAVLRDLIGKD